MRMVPLSLHRTPMSAQSGTGEEVCAAVEAHGPFQPLLDRSCRPDSAGVLKWKQRIREELSHRSSEQGEGWRGAATLPLVRW